MSIVLKIMMKSKRKGVQASYRIDFTTFDSSVLKTISANIGWGISVVLYRIGNLVLISQKTNNTQVMSAGSYTLTEKIPNGFRPYNTGTIIGAAPNQGADPSWQIYGSGGSMDFWNNISAPINSVITVIGIWFTDDEYPTD